MKRILKRSFLLLLLLLTVYTVWINTGQYSTDLTLPEANIEIAGDTMQAGANVLGIQPYLTQQHYATPGTLVNTLRHYLQIAKEAGLLRDSTIIVFPEYTGTWLVAAGEKPWVINTTNLQQAMTRLVLGNPVRFARAYLSASAGDKTKYALFAMKANITAKAYQEIFSGLAREFACTVVAGSAVLQNPQVDNEGNIICSAGPLYNCSAVFGPDGKLAGPLVKKVYPITDELGFTSCGKADAKPVFNTHAGAMGLLVCADSWYPQAYAALSGKCDFLVVPSLAGTEAFWQSPWKGYNGGPAPQDVDSADIGRLTEGQAWARYSMGTRAPAASIHQGINVFFTGTMWDMTPEGRVLMLKHDSLDVLPPAIKHGRIVNLVLEKKQ